MDRRMVDHTVEEPVNVPDEHHTWHLRYAVIPAEVFFDEKLSDPAKLLFPIIHLLDKGEDGCFASNAYLAKEIGCTDREIRRRIAELKDRGHISVCLKDFNQRTIHVASHFGGGRTICSRGGGLNSPGGGPDGPGGRTKRSTEDIVEEEKKDSYSGLPLGLTEDCNPKMKTSVRGTRPAKTPKPPAPNMDHPAVIDYRDVMKLTPSENKREMIVGAVEDLELWGKVIRQWEALGFNKGNVVGMLESYKEGGVETRSKKKKTASDITREVMAKYKEGIESGKIRGIL